MFILYIPIKVELKVTINNFFMLVIEIKYVSFFGYRTATYEFLLMLKKFYVPKIV